jgi:hypothetical protein
MERVQSFNSQLDQTKTAAIEDPYEGLDTLGILDKQIADKRNSTGFTKEEKEQKERSVKIEGHSREFENKVRKNKIALEPKKWEEQYSIPDEDISRLTAYQMEPGSFRRALTTQKNFISGDKPPLPDYKVLFDVYSRKLGLTSKTRDRDDLTNYAILSQPKNRGRAIEANEHLKHFVENAKEYGLDNALEADRAGVSHKDYREQRKLGFSHEDTMHQLANRFSPQELDEAGKAGIDEGDYKRARTFLSHSAILDKADKGLDIPEYIRGLDSGVNREHAEELVNAGMGKNNNTWKQYQFAMTPSLRVEKSEGGTNSFVPTAIGHHEVVEAMKSGMNIGDYALQRRRRSHQEIMDLAK